MLMTIDVIPTGTSTATVILSQDEVDAVRGTPGRARVPLAITHDGQVFRTSISVYQGRWMMVVNREMRDGGLVPGGSYTVDVGVDTAERTVEVPPDLAAALESAGLTAAWTALSYTARKEYVRGLLDAKKPETRSRRLSAVVTALDG
jgi:hypothetical protein